MKGDAIAAHVRAMARGPSRGRGLTREEAKSALGAILAGEAAAEAVGALFMLMRYRGESADEVAGFVEALRARLVPWGAVGAAVDWPSYAAGRTRGLPLFLVAARLVAASGRPVMLHGWNSHLTHPVGTAAGAAALAIPEARTPDGARAALAERGIAYAPLAALDGEALRLLRLREVLGLRSPINTALRAVNPAAAPVTVQGVFHPSYRGLQTDAARLLGQPAVGVLKGGGGEFERHPGKMVELWGYMPEGDFEHEMAPLAEIAPRRMREDDAALSPDMLSAFWSGALVDEFAAQVVIATAGAALHVAGAGDLPVSQALAADLWEGRCRNF
ncbi:MAG: glycosyl transferase family protein [Paracoccaceae bacterium]